MLGRRTYLSVFYATADDFPRFTVGSLGDFRTIRENSTERTHLERSNRSLASSHWRLAVVRSSRSMWYWNHCPHWTSYSRRHHSGPVITDHVTVHAPIARSSRRSDESALDTGTQSSFSWIYDRSVAADAMQSEHRCSVDRTSTEDRPNIDRGSTDIGRTSTEHRPSIDVASTDYRRIHAVTDRRFVRW